MRKLNLRKMLAWIGLGDKPAKDIHARLAETIAERKKILLQWEKLFNPKSAIGKKDIHDQLRETIAELKRAKQQHGSGTFSKPEREFTWKAKRAA